jgi:hypothetical protein
MSSLTASASALGEWVEHDIDLGRGPLSDLELAEDVRTLTIDQLEGALAEVDLDRGVVLVRGPAEPLKRVFEILHRVPALVHFDQARKDAVADDPLAQRETTTVKRRRKQEDINYLEPALTEEAPRSRWSIDVLPAYTRASYVDPQAETLDSYCCTGGGVAVNLGHAFDNVKTVGFHAAIATLRGHRQYKRGLFSGKFDTELLPIDLGFFARFEKSRVWGSVWLGLHLDRLYNEHLDATMPSVIQWSKSLGIGIQAGVDLLKIGPHRIAAAGAIDGAPGSTSGYGALWLGLACRVSL